MPELPEVETVRLQLTRNLIGKHITGVEVRHDKTVAYDKTISSRLKGKVISDIERIGKLLIFSFTGESDLYLLAHLKMTGQFLYRDTRGQAIGGGHSLTLGDTELPNKHTRTIFHFTDGTALYFNDMRLFGYTKLADHATLMAARATFGPEPLDDAFDCDLFTKRLRQRKTSVKAALLDQSFVAGLGNIYVDETLWRAGVRPGKRADRVSKRAAAALCAAAGDILRAAILAGGTTFQHFVDTGGAHGNYTDLLKVFGKQGESCERCGSIIKKVRCAGRGTHYCPRCQT